MQPALRNSILSAPSSPVTSARGTREWSHYTKAVACFEVVVLSAAYAGSDTHLLIHRPPALLPQLPDPTLSSTTQTQPTCCCVRINVKKTLGRAPSNASSGSSAAVPLTALAPPPSASKVPTHSQHFQLALTCPVPSITINTAITPMQGSACLLTVRLDLLR